LILRDTNIVVAYLNGRAHLAQQNADHLPGIAIPSLVAAELYFGACASTRAEENLAKLDRFLQIIPTVHFDLSAARTCGTLKADLRKRGRPTGEVDAWITAMALTHAATLVTHNTKDFQHIAGLRLEDWLATSS